MDTGGDGGMGGIFATIQLDTNNAEVKAAEFGKALELAANAAKGLDASSAAASKAIGAVGNAAEASAEKVARAAEARADREAKAAERAAKAVELKAERAAKAEAKAAAQQEADYARLQAALKRMDDRSTADHNDAVQRRVTASMQAIQATKREADADRAHFEMQRGWRSTHIDMDALGIRSSAGARSGAGDRARAGFAVANMAQDMIQGSPAAGINNAMFIAGDRGMRAVAVDAVAALGGVKAIAAGFGTLAIGAGAAFLLINKGLKDAKLEWGDLGSVIGNLTPIHAVTEAFGGFIDAVASSPVGTVLGATWGGIKAATGYIADVTIGWTEAAKAAKLHKDEVIAAGQAIKQAADDQKALAKFKSDEQKAKEKAGDLMGRELAALGGAEGIEGVVDKLARRITAKGGDDEVEQEYVDEKGETQTRKIKKRDLAKEQLRRQFALATEGDTSALDAVSPLLDSAGYNTAGVRAARQGRDLKDEEKTEFDRTVKKWKGDNTEDAKIGEEERKDAANLEADQLMAQGRENEKIGKQRLAAENADDRRDEAEDRKALAAQQRLSKAERQLHMSPAEKKADNLREMREKAGGFDPMAPVPGRAGRFPGGAGDAPALPNLPAAPGAAAMGGGRTEGLLETIVGRLDKLIDTTGELDMGDATFG